MDLLIEYFRPSGSPVRVVDLGLDFLEAERIPLANAERPFRELRTAKLDRAGSERLNYSRSGLALPDGGKTTLAINGRKVTTAVERWSRAAGVVRVGRSIFSIDGATVEVVVILEENNGLCTVNVTGHRLACPRCGSPLARKQIRLYRSVRYFLGCAAFPRCRYNRDL